MLTFADKHEKIMNRLIAFIALIIISPLLMIVTIWISMNNKDVLPEDKQPKHKPVGFLWYFISNFHTHNVFIVERQINGKDMYYNAIMFRTTGKKRFSPMLVNIACGNITLAEWLNILRADDNTFS